MKYQLPGLCLVALALAAGVFATASGCATAELINPPPLAPCDATNDCPLPDAGTDGSTDGASEAATDASDGSTRVDASDGGSPDASKDAASDGDADADAAG